MNGHPWDEGLDKLLTVLYQNTPMPKLVSILGRTERAIYSRANLLGIKRSQAFLEGEHGGRLRGDEGKETRFAKGHKTWNAGMKGWTAGGRSAETRFKPGTLNGTAAERVKPVGHERTTKDGILQRKIRADGPLHRRWKAVHTILWEEHNGPVPAGHLVVFRDRNRNNMQLDNLELITRAQNCQRNTIHRYSAELKGIIRLQKKLERAIRRHDEKQTKRSA